MLISALILYFYLLLFYASIVLAFGANHTLTLEHYRVIFSEGLPAIKDTLIIALIGMPLGGLYGIVVGYLVGRTNFIGRKAMEVVSMLNYALPGTIVGIAYLLAFNDEPLALTGTATILIACYVFRYSPIGIRTTIALLQQIDKSMEEASASLGAGHLVDIPPHHAAADPAGVLCRSRRRLHPLDDRDQRHDLSGLDQLDADHREDPRKHDRGRARAGRGLFGVRDRRRGVRDQYAQHPVATPDRAEPARQPDRGLRHGGSLDRNPACRASRRPFITKGAATSRR